ncbi:hypothetical protein FRC04_011548 [Tulasnella sp. 424]|nr:hypothetical protein FRC04_011548 [Tulasnella sp. 424]
MNITTADDDHGPPQFAPFPESAFTFGGSNAAAGVGGVGGYGAAATATLRRVKPLPRSKRRRVSDEEAGLLTPADVVALQQQQQHLLQGVTAGHASANANTAAFPFGATTTAAAWTGSMPGGYPAGFAFDLAGVYHQQQGGAAEDYHQGAANHEDDGAGQDGTGRDRGDQQGNTKKRKVPAAAHHGGHFRGGSPSDDGDANGVIGADDQLDRRGEHDTTGMGDGGAAAASAGMIGRDAGLMVGSGKPRLSISSATGIKLKEIAKIRKRLLSSVLGPASSSSSPSSTPTTTTTGDNLALDIALSAPLKWPPQVSLPTTTEPLASPKRRQRKRVLERRKKQRAAIASGSRCVLPAGEFTLDVPSQSSERMKTTTAEITSYRVKFAQELARISAKQAEAAKKAAAAAANAKNGGLGSGTMTKKLSDGSKAGSSPGGGPGSKLTTDGGSTTSKKKKKRSTKANDPHQIRNYIPSRLPAGAGVPQPPTPAQAAQNLKSLISPHPVQFLSAEPRRRTKKSSKGSDGNKENARPTVTSSLPPVQPADEWICSFCEFNLFYGDDAALRRAVRARKSLLRRRRRARERAAAAASGQGKLLSASARKGEESDGEEELPEEEQEAKFADPAEVDARVAASMGDVSRKPVVRDKGGGGGGVPPGGVGGGSTTASAMAKA